MDIKVISFDIGNTIYKVETNHTICDKLAAVLNLKTKDIRDAYDNIFDYSDYSLKEKVKKFCDILNKSNYSKVILENIKTIIKNAKLEYVDNDIEDFLMKLKTDGYILIAVSKSSKIHSYIKNQHILKLFDRVYRTSDLKLSKKNGLLYKYIAKDLNVEYSQIIHVGDNYFDDYIIPRKCGINAILYNNKKISESCKKLDEVYSKILEIQNNIKILRLGHWK